MKNTWVISLILILASLLLIVYSIAPKSNENGEGGKGSLPYYALKNEKIKEAYIFAGDNPDALNGVNCYCGCMEVLHYGRIHKRGLIDCFLKENGKWDIHASQCPICVSDALLVKNLVSQNKTNAEIKKIIDEKYVKL